MSRRVLVVGGAGAFGARLVRGLLARTDLDVVLAGRNLARAEDAVQTLNTEWPERSLSAVVLDRDRATAEALGATGAFVVVDAAGPFQGAEARLAEAAIAAGIHYVDLADARDFVAAFRRLDDAAKQAGVTAVTGASSTPALSQAALDRLTAGWRTVDTVEFAISPGNRAPRGLSVIAAILSYAGRPVRVFVDGAWRTRPGWGMLTRRTFGSHVDGIGRRWLSLCETPDLDITPARFHGVRIAIFRAGLELPVLHLGLWAASLPVRARLLPSLTPLARAFRAAAALFSRFGTDRGGMLVEASGADAAGRATRATWTLVAEAGDGPTIPSLPALALIRQLAEAEMPRGAFTAADLLSLDAIEAEFVPYRIRTQTTLMHTEDNLFPRVLGDGFHDMPEPIRQAHLFDNRLKLAGEASVAPADNMIGRAVAFLFRLPQPGSAIPVTVTMEQRGAKEIWTRDFDGKRFHSVLGMAPDGRMSERFSLITFDMDVPGTRDGLTMDVTGWRLGPIRLPQWLAPTGKARESLDACGRFQFDVTIRLPLIGRLVGYRGWLVPAADSET